MSKVDQTYRADRAQWGDARPVKAGRSQSFAFVRVATPAPFFLIGAGDMTWTVTVSNDRNVLQVRTITAAQMRAGVQVLGQALRVEGRARIDTDASLMVIPLVNVTQELAQE